jgi:hypothetical protein
MRYQRTYCDDVIVVLDEALVEMPTSLATELAAER